MRLLRHTALLLLLLAGLAAQAAPSCPESAQEITPQALAGTWQARFDGLAEPATVHFWPHPEYAGVRGTIARGPLQAQLAGDIDDEGVLGIDESEDGRAISAVWSAELQPGSCGKEFKGTWRNAKDDSTRPFVLTRAAALR